MYKTIYPYMVTDIVSTGKTVFVVDKMERVVKLCNVMTVSDFFQADCCGGCGQNKPIQLFHG